MGQGFGTMKAVVAAFSLACTANQYIEMAGGLSKSGMEFAYEWVGSFINNLARNNPVDGLAFKVICHAI